MRMRSWIPWPSRLLPKAFGCAQKRAPFAPQVYALRLLPEQDLKLSLLAFARQHGLRAASVITCVGSLQRVHLRLADQEDGVVLEGKYEIVSLVGTLHAEAGAHFHLAVSDGQGHMVGGHLLDGSLVYTTAEVALLEAPELEFARVLDPLTGYRELVIGRRSKDSGS